MGTPLEELTYAVERMQEHFDDNLREIEHRIGELPKVLDKDEIESLAQKALAELDGIDTDTYSLDHINNCANAAYDFITKLLKELK